ncbi:MAG: glycosyltransferase family 4 protein [Myxococcales bacterium]|nr:glycosyltransferase family 4 protein [Myxococcales bacterium]
MTVESEFLQTHARPTGAVIEPNTPSSGAIRRVALLGNHLPRQCGIATFTTDLASAIAREYDDLECFVLAVNDKGHRYDYPERVRFSISEGDVESYRRAADYLNVSGVDALLLQHEFGIFGGPAGAHVLALMRDVNMPVLTTLHTVLPSPDSAQRVVMDEIIQRSDRLVVMSNGAASLLHQAYGARTDHIDVIPHGTPLFPERAARSKLGLDGRDVLLTFGLLSEGKGVEYVIDALPGILERFPDVVFVIVGATHPRVKELEGERYRLMLEERAQRRGVASAVIFHDRFVSHDELVQFLSVADVFLTPYLNEAQSTSGALAYAIGAGVASVSTPFRYARELLSDGRGALVPFRDSGAICREVCALLEDSRHRAAISSNARAFAQTSSWPVVAQSYVRSAQRASTEHSRRARSNYRARTLAARPIELPAVSLGHLQSMSDGTGLLQHALFDVPRYEDGYCVDDNARGLRAMVLAEEAAVEPLALVRSLAGRYLAFLAFALDRDSGRFRNTLSFQRTWVEPVGSEDCHGRALWALGTLVARGSDHARRELGRELFRRSLPASLTFSSPRAWAYTLLGLDEFSNAFEGDSDVDAARDTLAHKLMELFARSRRPGWPWFEDSLTYCNARMPQALLVSGARMGVPAMVEPSLEALEWLINEQRSDNGDFAAIGSNGFYPRGGPKALFDQQPVEACAMISACIDARRVTNNSWWSHQARRVFRWYVGQNHLRLPLYDATTGGCRDALHESRVNENQGAESTLSFLLSLLEIKLSESATALAAIPPKEPVAEVLAGVW